VKNARLLAVLLALVAIFASLTSGASAAALALKKDWIYRDGLLFATVDSSGTKYVHLDHLGTPRRITNSSRAVIASHDYYPFGEEITSSSQDSEALKFPGHERDLRDPTKTTDDLDYMHARFYNPWLGRFLSTDPMGGTPGAPQSWNRYSYVMNNPMKFIDPNGAEVMVFVVQPSRVPDNWKGVMGHLAVFVTSGDRRAGVSYGGASFKGGVGGFIDAYAQEGRDVKMFVLRTTPQQDSAMVDFIAAEGGSGGVNQDAPLADTMLAENCTTAVENVLEAGGVIECAFRKFWPVGSGNSGRFL
jgi:RHS repeat-associated protein